MSFSLSDFDYYLPDAQIAHTPTERRDKSKLLKYNKLTKEVSDHTFDEFSDLIPNNSVIVFNNTKVLKARVICYRESGAKIECFFLKKISEKRWEVIIKNSRRISNNETLIIDKKNSIKVIEKKDKCAIVCIKSNMEDFEFLENFGKTPLPPYIKTKDPDKFHERYQSIFASNPGAVAAPTASLHFTDKIFSQLKSKNIEILYVTLHIGLGTFNPITKENIIDHKMHKENYSITKSTAAKLNQAKKEKKPIFAVGTTVARCLESNIKDNLFSEQTTDTDLYIFPGYEYKGIDGLLTNFHLPKSSLFILVAAMIGLKNIQDIYQHAIEHDYRFFSFGDAMLIS